MDERRQINFRLDPHLADHLQRRAVEDDSSMSRILRQLVAKDYEREKRKLEREQVAAG